MTAKQFVWNYLLTRDQKQEIRSFGHTESLCQVWWWIAGNVALWLIVALIVGFIGTTMVIAWVSAGAYYLGWIILFDLGLIHIGIVFSFATSACVVAGIGCHWYKAYQESRHPINYEPGLIRQTYDGIKYKFCPYVNFADVDEE